MEERRSEAAYLGLLFVGAVLFVNGLALLGKVEPKSAARVFAPAIGAVGLPNALLATAKGSELLTD